MKYELQYVNFNWQCWLDANRNPRNWRINYSMKNHLCHFSWIWNFHWFVYFAQLFRPTLPWIHMDGGEFQNVMNNIWIFYTHQRYVRCEKWWRQAMQMNVSAWLVMAYDIRCGTVWWMSFWCETIRFALTAFFHSALIQLLNRTHSGAHPHICFLRGGFFLQIISL